MLLKNKFKFHQRVFKLSRVLFTKIADKNTASVIFTFLVLGTLFVFNKYQNYVDAFTPTACLANTRCLIQNNWSGGVSPSNASNNGWIQYSSSTPGLVGSSILKSKFTIASLLHTADNDFNYVGYGGRTATNVNISNGSVELAISAEGFAGSPIQTTLIQSVSRSVAFSNTSVSPFVAMALGGSAQKAGTVGFNNGFWGSTLSSPSSNLVVDGTSNSVAISHDDNYIAVGAGGGVSKNLYIYNKPLGVRYEPTSQNAVDGAVNGVAFRSKLQSDGQGSYYIIALAHNAGAHFSIYKFYPSITSNPLQKVSNPNIQISTNCNDAAFNPTGDFVAVVCQGATAIPSFFVYKITESGVVTSMTINAQIPAQASNGVAFSTVNNYVAIVTNERPTLRTYKIKSDFSGVEFISSADPTASTAVAFSPDESALTVVYGSSPYFQSYQLNNGAIIGLPIVPGSTIISSIGMAFDVVYNSDGQYIIIGHQKAQGFSYYLSAIKRTKGITSGSFTSGIIDLGQTEQLKTFDYSALQPADSSVSMSFRTANDTNTILSQSWMPVASSGADISGFGKKRFVQYKAEFNTTNINSRPALNEVSISYQHYEQATYIISSPLDMGTQTDFPVVKEVQWREFSNTATRAKLQIRTAPTGKLNPDGSFAAPYDVWSPDIAFSKLNACSTQTVVPSELRPGEQPGTQIITCSVDTQNSPVNASERKYVQYKITLESDDGENTPEVYEVRVTYVINHPPVATGVSASQITTGSNIGLINTNYSVSDEDGDSNLFGELFYDAGITLDNDISSSAETINFSLPDGVDLANLGLPDAGVILIDNEEIYYTRRGGTFVAGYSSLGQPLIRGYGPLSGAINLSTSKTSHVAGRTVWIKALTVSGNGIGDIPCPSGVCTSKSVLWNAGADFPGKYSSAQKVRAVINDRKAAKQSGVGDSDIFSFDTKSPDLGTQPLSLNEEAELKNITGYGWKSSKTPVIFDIGVPITSNASGQIDNNPSSDYLSFCGATACAVSPTGAELLAGTATGWSSAPLPVWTSSYTKTLASQETSPQTINLAVVDSVGNRLLAGAQTIAYDKTSPPLPAQANFTAQDISGSLGKAAIYLKWEPILWTTQKDAYGRQDFKNFIIYRHEPTTAGCSNGSALVGGLTFCYVATLPDSTGTNVTSYVDEGVVDTKTYTYRVITEDDIGNKLDVASASVPQSAPLKVAVSGAPKIIPQLTFLSKTTQSDYSDTVTIYWETRDSSGVGLGSDSQVAYVESQTLPASFENASTQGNATPASIGVVQADGSCACHKVTLIGLKAGTRYFFEMRSTYGSETGKLSGSSYYIDTMPAPPKVKATIDNIQPADGAVLATSNSATITWDTKDSNGVPMDTNGYVDYLGPNESNKKSVGSEAGEKSHTVFLSGLSANTSYTYTVRSTPTIENSEKTESSTRSFKTKVATEDTETPQINNIRITSNTGTGAQICWDTPNEPGGASSIIEIWTGPNNHMVRQTPNEYVQNNHCVTLDTLTPKTDYIFQAISYDTAVPPNRGESGETPLTTSEASAIPNPAIKNLRNDSPSPNSVVIYWDTVSASDDTQSVDSDSTVYIGTNPTSFEMTPVSSPALTANHIVTVTGFTQPGKYYYKVKSANANKIATPDDATAYTCKDSSGASQTCSFTIPDAPEDAPKVYTTGLQKIRVLVSADDATVTNTATIMWNTDKAGNSLVEFGSEFVDKPNGDRVPKYERGFVGNANESDTSHVVVLPKDLVENTNYYFRVRTVDKYKQVAQHPPSDPTSLDDADDVYPSCDFDPADNPNRYNCLNPSFKTAASEFVQAQETKEPLDISGVGAVLVTDTTATINWSTNRSADSEVYFGESENYGCLNREPCPLGDKYKIVVDGKTTTNIKVLTRAHSVTISELTPSTITKPSTYYYKVASTDTADIREEKNKNVAGAYLTFTMSEGTGKYTEAQYKSIQEQLDKLTLELQDVNNQLEDNLAEQEQIQKQLEQTNLTQAQIDDLQRQLAELKSQQAQLQQIQANIVAEKAQLEDALEEQKAQSLDQVPPIITDIKVSNITPESAIISWTTDEEASSIVQYGETVEYDSLAGDYATLTTDHTVQLENLDGGTEYHFIVISYDASVNRAESDDATFETPGFKKTDDEKEKLKEAKDKLSKALGPNSKLNTQNIINLLSEFSEEQIAKLLNDLGIQLISPPSFTGGDPKVDVTQTTATISWITNKESDSRIAYVQNKDYKADATNPYPTETGDTERFTKEHSVVISDLKPGTLYHFQLRSREAAGRTGKSKDYTFKTLPERPAIVNIKVVDHTEHTVTLGWKTSTPTKTLIEYTNTKTGKKQSQGDAQLVTAHEFTLINLESDSAYVARIRAENEEGTAILSPEFHFATVKDITPPEVTQLRTDLSLVPGKKDVVQAVVSWRTSEPSTSKVIYEEGLSKSAEFKESTTEQMDLVTFHVVVLTKLNPATIYRFKAVSSDEAGNIGSSKEFKILTPKKEESVLELIIKNFEETFGFLNTK